MTTTPSPDASPGTQMTDAEYGALRASAALWAGTSVLITDERGRVLIQHVDYRPTCLLPGGAVDANEPPARGAARELREELGLTMTVDRGLAVDWIDADSLDAPADMRFPGEILHVYDGGTWNDELISTIQLPDQEITSVEFVEPARLPDLMSPGDARRALSALRARIDSAGPALLENGIPIAPTVLDRAGALRTVRARHHLPFHAGPAPEQLTVVQAWGWLLGPDGRVLVLLEPDTGAALLPGGGPELPDRGDPRVTLAREAREEAAAEFGEPLLLGHLREPDKPYARLRYAAPLTRLGPPPVDPATGRTHFRALATPEQALELFDWGPEAADQLAAVHHARARLGIPRAARQPLTELPDAIDLSVFRPVPARVETRTRTTHPSPALGTPPVPARPLPAARAASEAAPPVRTGHCQCGRISYQVTGVPDDPHVCSCVNETRISGGPAVLWVGFPLKSLRWTGPGGDPKWYAAHPTLRRGFCPDCGTHLVSLADGSSTVMVTGFSLTDQSGIEPLGHSFRDNAVPWMHITLAPGPIVLMSDPRVAAVPVADCGEPLVDVRGSLPVDDRRADTTGSYAHLRSGVLDRLVQAQSFLPDGLRLLLVEGYRPPDLQRLYFEKYADDLRADNPAWSDDQVHQAASRFVSPPEIAPHSAGAAVDLTLVDADGIELDMGTRVNANPEESGGACYTDTASIGPRARTNRALLVDALSAAGLVNYGTEWWHWSYGDRYWALMTNQPAALYGPRALH